MTGEEGMVVNLTPLDGNIQIQSFHLILCSSIVVCVCVNWKASWAAVAAVCWLSQRQKPTRRRLYMISVITFGCINSYVKVNKRIRSTLIILST